MRFLIFITIFNIAFSYTINFAYVTSNDTPKGQAALLLKKEIETLSKGKIKVNLIPNSPNENILIQKLKENKIQIVAPAISKLSLKEPRLGVFSLPFLFKSRKHLYKVLDGEIGQELLKSLSNNHFLALTYWYNGFKKLTNSKRELKLPKDCNGLTFRIMNSKVLIEQFRTLNAIPVILPFSATYQALKEGIVDGEENTISNIYSKNFYKVQKYMTISNHGYLGYIVLINKKFLNSLPKNLQEIVLKSIKDITKKERSIAVKYNQALLKKIEKSNIKIHYLTKKEKSVWEKKLKTIYPLFYKEIGKDLIEKIEKLN